MIPYIRKLERNKFEVILVFLKWFLWGFIVAEELFALFESWMRGNEMTSQTFILAFWSQWIQSQFKHKTLEWRWHDFFHLFKWKGLLKIFEFHLKIFQIQKTLSNSMIFMREDKMTSSKHMKYELEVLKELNSKSHWNYFQFGVIWVLFELFFSKNKIYGK